MQKDILAEETGFGLWYSTGEYYTKFYWCENENEALTYMNGVKCNHPATFSFYLTDTTGVTHTSHGTYAAH